MNPNQIRSNSNIKTFGDHQVAINKSPVALSMNSPKDQNQNDKMLLYLGDGWCTFPDLDNFDSDKLLRALTLKEKDSADSIWDPSLTVTELSKRKNQQISVSALRQLEALFNLTQLLFGLSRAETVNYTFRDLQFRKHPHSFKKSGFKLLNTDGRVDFYAVFEQLVRTIIEQGGLEISLLMYRNPALPMVRQKCLDLISNVATVPEVAYKIMVYQSWFLDHLLIMIRDGDIVSDKIPALSVLIRLLKVMLTERMLNSYMKLVDFQYIDCLVDIFENPKYTDSNEFLPFFIKFEFISMQSLTVILGDVEYSRFWSDKAKTRLLNYCMIVLLKAAGAYPANQTINSTSNLTINSTNTINHIFYAEQHTNKHSLAHTIMTVTELLRNDENMKLFYRYHKPFKQLIIQLYKKYGAKSEFSRIDPGISYALNHLMRVLYIKNSTQNQSVESQIRVCSNPQCKNEETKFKEFRACEECDGKLAAYCSRKCLKEHSSHHLKYECKLSEKFCADSIYQSLSRTKRLSKYSSMNENHRRTSLTFGRSRATHYTKHTSSMKEIKSKENSINFVRPLKTSTALCLPQLKHTNSSSSSGSSLDQPSKKFKFTHIRRHSEATNFNDSSSSSSSSENETIEQESDQEEIEEERYDSNDVRTRGSTNKVESPETSDLYNLDSSSSSSSNNADEQERKSKFKVIKEFEKTLEFVKNASNLKVMPLSETEKKTDDSLKQPQISIASLYYDRNNSTNFDESDESSSDEDTNSDKKNTTDTKNQRVNLIINNSLASSHVSDKKPQVSRDYKDFVDDEMSVFKNEALTSAQSKANDLKTFKIPLLPEKKQDQLPLSLQPIQIQPNEYLLKNNKIYNELKVFNDISNFDSTNPAQMTMANNLNLNPLIGELPKNSTPIYSDNTTAAYLTAKRKKLLNAKLDLTIAPPNESVESKTIERKPSNFVIPKAKSTPVVPVENFVTSTLRSTNNLLLSSKKSSKMLTVPGIETKVISGSLEISKLSAIENVVTSTNLISVAKEDMPIDIQKRINKEIKRDRAKCSIQ